MSENVLGGNYETDMAYDTPTSVSVSDLNDGWKAQSALNGKNVMEDMDRKER